MTTCSDISSILAVFLLPLPTQQLERNPRIATDFLEPFVWRHITVFEVSEVDGEEPKLAFPIPHWVDTIRQVVKGQVVVKIVFET